jgi:hypothetical protein
MLGKEGTFFVQGHQSPASAASALAVEPGWAKRVVFGHPLPDRLRGHRQQVGHAMSSKRSRMSQPDRQPALLAELSQ